MHPGKQTPELEFYSSRLGFTIEKWPPSPSGTASRYRIISANDLRRLVERQKLFLLPRKDPRIIVELPCLSPKERERWSKTLNKYYYECGCRHGAAFLLIGAILLLIRFVLFGFSPLGIWFLLVAPSFVFLLSGVGKTSGILWSKMQLRRSVNRLLYICNSTGSVTSELLNCPPISERSPTQEAPHA